MRFILLVCHLLIGACYAMPTIIGHAAMAPTLKGVTYTPIGARGHCDSAGQITKAVKQMKAVGIKSIRTYQQNCNQLSTILKAIHSTGGGMTVLAGVYLDNSKNDAKEIATLESVLQKKQNTKYIEGIIVGNELVFGGKLTSAALVQKIKQVKSFAKGFKVGTAEIYTTYTQDLIDASDFISVNLHPFFSQVDIKDAFANLNAQYTNFKKLTNKKVVISETGWPSQGNNFGGSQPSVANMKIYATALAKSKLPYYFFEWHDSVWKHPGDLNVENHWGLLDKERKFKIKFPL